MCVCVMGLIMSKCKKLLNIYKANRNYNSRAKISYLDLLTLGINSKQITKIIVSIYI